LLIIFLFFVPCFLPFFSNTSILSISILRANLNAQNAGNGISGLQILKLFWGNMPPEPVAFSHSYPSLIYYLTERSLFKKFPPPHGKILKRCPDQYTKKKL
jgi:hypothetical protein